MTTAPTPSSSLGLLLRFLMILNVADTFMTLGVIGLKWATEANPIMGYLLQAGPLAFGAGKLILSGGGALLLWKGRQSHWAVPAAQFCVFVYSAVVAYELAMILELLYRM